MVKLAKGLLPRFHTMSGRQKQKFKGTLLHKRSIIERVLTKQMTVKEASIELGVWPRSVRRMSSCASQQRLTAFPGLPSRLRVRYGKWHQMETELYNWIVEVNMHFRYIKAGCSMAVICQKAREIGKKNNISGFSPSNGWFGRFCMRFDLVRYVIEIARFLAFNFHLILCEQPRLTWGSQQCRPQSTPRKNSRSKENSRSLQRRQHIQHGRDRSFLQDSAAMSSLRKPECCKQGHQGTQGDKGEGSVDSHLRVQCNRFYAILYSFQLFRIFIFHFSWQSQLLITFIHDTFLRQLQNSLYNYRYIGRA
jgi:hypothetical protein